MFLKLTYTDENKVAILCENILAMEQLEDSTEISVRHIGECKVKETLDEILAMIGE